MPDVSGLVKKTNYDTKILDIDKKNTSLLLIIINLQKYCFLQRQKKRN